MGSGNRKLQTNAVIDTDVTVLAVVSHFWDISCSVSSMVAPYLAIPSIDVTNPPDNSAKAMLRVADHDIAETSRPEKLARLSMPLTSELTMELDWAQLSLGLAADEILFAALGRTIARVIGDGVVAVDVAGEGRSVYLTCATVQQASATEMLRDVHRTVADDRHQGFGHGLLQYHDAPPALRLAGRAPSEIFFNYVGTVPELPSGEPLSETPRVGHALELRVYRTTGLLHLDWLYDTRRFYRSTVEELTEQFPFALIEVASDAIPPI
jgi:hypothetical protein